MSIFVLDNIGRMAEEKNQKVIRISSVADGKLSEIAKRNHLSKSKAASRIINHYYASNIGVDMPSSEDFSRMVNVLSNLDGKYSKLIGPVERTEDFIKSLVRETRNDESDPYIMESKDAQPGGASSVAESSSPRALDLLGRMLSVPKPATDFDGRAAMQIRLSQEDFMQIKLEYEQLCTSQNL